MRQLLIGSVSIPFVHVHVLVTLGGKTETGNISVLLPAIQQLLAAQDGATPNALIIDPTGALSAKLADLLNPAALQVIQVDGAPFNPLQQTPPATFAADNSDLLIEADPYLASLRYQDDRPRRLVEAVLRALQTVVPTPQINLAHLRDGINEPEALLSAAAGFDSHAEDVIRLRAAIAETPDSLKLVLKHKAEAMIRPFLSPANAPFLKNSSQTKPVTLLNGAAMDRQVLRMLATALTRRFSATLETQGFFACEGVGCTKGLMRQ